MGLFGKSNIYIFKSKNDIKFIVHFSHAHWKTQQLQCAIQHQKNVCCSNKGGIFREILCSKLHKIKKISKSQTEIKKHAFYNHTVLEKFIYCGRMRTGKCRFRQEYQPIGLHQREERMWKKGGKCNRSARWYGKMVPWQHGILIHRRTYDVLCGTPSFSSEWRGVSTSFPGRLSAPAMANSRRHLQWPC